MKKTLDNLYALKVILEQYNLCFPIVTEVIQKCFLDIEPSEEEKKQFNKILGNIVVVLRNNINHTDGEELKRLRIDISFIAAMLLYS